MVGSCARWSYKKHPTEALRSPFFSASFEASIVYLLMSGTNSLTLSVLIIKGVVFSSLAFITQVGAVWLGDLFGEMGARQYIFVFILITRTFAIQSRNITIGYSDCTNCQFTVGPGINVAIEDARRKGLISNDTITRSVSWKYSFKARSIYFNLHCTFY